MTKLKPAYVYLAVGVALILGWFYCHIQPEYRLQLTCKGTSYARENGEEVSREQNVVFGVMIERYKVLWGDGAYVYTARFLESGISSYPYPSYFNFKNEDGRLEITENTTSIGMEHTELNKRNRIIFSHVTQTLHVAEEKGDREEFFDGECRQTPFFVTPLNLR